MEPTCPKCKSRIFPDFYFCPICGRKLKQVPLSTSFAKQFGLYALSFFVPPFGLIPAFKYLQQPGVKPIVVGCVAIILTAISIMIVTYFLMQSIALFLPITASTSSIH